MGEFFCPDGTRAAAYLRAPEGSGESNPICVGGGGSAAVLGSFARGIRPRQVEERGVDVVSSRERAACDLQSLFRRTSEGRAHACRWRLGEHCSREEQHRSLVHRQISDEGEGCSRYHDGGTYSGGDAAAASSQGVNHNVISHSSVDVVGLGQSPVDAPSLSKLRLCVIAAWTGAVVDAAMARITGADDTNPGEKRRVQSAPDSVLRNVRVVASEFMANVTETCLLYAVLSRDLRLTMTAAELETAAPLSAVTTSTETSRDSARTPGTGYKSALAKFRKDGEDTPVANRVSNAFTNSSHVHGEVPHIYFPTPLCSTSLVPPDSVDHRSCTGIPSLLQQGGTCSSEIFSRLDRGETEEVDDRPALVASSVLNSGNLTNAFEDGAAADMLMRRICDSPRENPRKPDENKTFAPIDAPRDNKTKDIPDDKSTVHYGGSSKSTVHSCGTASQLETHARESCTRGGSPPSAQTALQVDFAGVGTRPAEAMPRPSVTARWTRKGGGFLFRKRRCSPRIDCTGGGCGGGSSTDGGGEESVVSLLSASAVGHGGYGETMSPTLTTGLPRGEPVDIRDVAVGSDGGVTVGRKVELQVRRRHGDHATSGRPPKGSGTGDTLDTGIVHTIYGVAIGGSSATTKEESPILAENSAEESPTVFRYRVWVPDQHAPTSVPGRGRVFPVTDKELGAGAETCRGTGGSGNAAPESTGRRTEGSVSIRAAADTDGACSKVPRRVQPKPPHGAKTRSLTISPRKILYTRAAVSQSRYEGGGSQVQFLMAGNYLNGYSYELVQS